MLARDALDELNNFDYEQLKELKDELDHDRLVAGIKDQETPTSRRRIYLRLLSICGSKQDVPLLEEIMLSTEKSEKSALDGVIACYLALQGTAGLPLVEKRFLKNREADYAATFSAIVALRSEEARVLPHRQLHALRLMLDRPDMVDLVIPDLIRMDDWHHADRLFATFKDNLASDREGKKSWIRVPIINYLRECPLPRAKNLLEECERLDPASVKRAKQDAPDVAPNPYKFA